jgi:ribosome-associated protein
LAHVPANDYRDLALNAAQLALEKKGQDIYLLEVGQVSIVADYFLLVTGNSAVQVHAICDHIIESLKKAGCYALRIEGYREGWWVCP